SPMPGSAIHPPILWHDRPFTSSMHFKRHVAKSATCCSSRRSLVEVFLAKLIKMHAAAQQDEAITADEDLVARRWEFQAPIAALDGDNNHTGLPLDVGVPQAFAGERARGVQGHLVHLDRYGQTIGDQLGKLDSPWIREQRYDAVSANGGRHHDVV